MENITDSKVLANQLKDKLFTDYNKIYDFAEITTFAKGVLGEKYTKGKTAGTLTTLISNNIIQRIEKGKYKVIMKETDNLTMKELVTMKLKNTIDEIEDNLSNLNAILLPTDEFEMFLKVRNLLDNIKTDLNNL